MNRDKRVAPVIPMPDVPADTVLESLKNPNNIVPEHTDQCELPSKGQYYHPTNVLCGQEYIEIKYPTTKHQDILLNKTFINNQTSIDKLIEAVVANPAVKMNKMLLGDRNAISYQTRINMHGPMYKPRFICPFCLEKIKDITIDLEQSRRYKYLPSVSEMEAKGITVNNIEGYYSFSFKTSKRGTDIEFILADVEAENEIKKLSKNQVKNKLMETSRTNELRGLIKSINGKKGYELNKEIDKLLSLEVTEFLEMYNFVNPDVELKYDFTCPACGYEDEVPIMIDTNFFWYRP